MYDYEGSWKDSPAETGIAVIIALVSPVGAPLLGLITAIGCELAVGRAQCFVPDPIMDYAFMSAFAPFFLFGYFGFIWLALCLVMPLVLVWFFLCAWWGRSSAL
jgi:hypothetical protein